MTESSQLRQEENRIKWRCRQGSRELELVLIGFLQNNYSIMPRQEQVNLQQLLEHNNAELTEWLLYGADTYESDYSSLIEKIRKFQPTQL